MSPVLLHLLLSLSLSHFLNADWRSVVEATSIHDQGRGE